MMNLQEISDRLEIQQLMVDYANALDRRDWEAMNDVFTPDAYIDYRALGGVDGKFPEIKKWLNETLKRFPNFYHLMGNIEVKISGDTAKTKTCCFNPMVMDMGGDKTQTFLLGLWYHDKVVRTPKGWRIAERVEEGCFSYNVPAGLAVTG
jgi:3-phenylpropionate/cinnamic acid dioxygenase small subunit